MKRERYAMPDEIEKALVSHGVMEDYLQRPAYQQNDYIGWNTRKKRAIITPINPKEQSHDRRYPCPSR